MAQTVANLTQREKAKQFYHLHHSGSLLILPNIWDCLGANLLESLHYPAIATASASVAFTNGYDDGQQISFDSVIELLKRIVSSVNIPVSADIESGFADDDVTLKENIKRLIAAGIVGINFEDTDKETNSILPIEVQCEKIKLVKKVSEEVSIPLFINARADVYLRGKEFDTPESKFEEALKRGRAYKTAGADCFYPIGMTRQEDIKGMVEQLQMPVNVITIPGIPELNILNEMGVARVSLGPSFLKIAIRAMKNLALKLQNFEGLTDITGNEITSAYVKHLVNRNY
jgi:2-methylisocitrate lyase-like PEP mutase family enzyme